MLDKIRAIEKIQARQVELLKELKTAKDVEAGRLKYELKKEPSYNYYHLIDLRTGKMKSSGQLSRINSYCRIRKIDPQTVKNGQALTV